MYCDNPKSSTVSMCQQYNSYEDEPRSGRPSDEAKSKLECGILMKVFTL